MKAESPTSSDDLAKPFPFELVREDLSKVEEEIRQQAQEFDPAVEGYIAYICDTAGKRIRPALALLAGGATNGGEPNADHRRLGTVLELVHIASLVHDDIMDKADVRRGTPTANAKWGTSLSVLLGDSLFAHALLLSTQFEGTHVCRQIAIASREVCTGEIIQTQRQFDLQLPISEYYRIIEMKTAALFAAAAELAASISGADEKTQVQMRDYGMKLGTAYQVYDDCLDLVGEQDTVGKTLRTDLEKGKLTLPILNLINSATEVQRDKLGRLLLEREPIDLNTLAGIADYEGALDGALQSAIDLALEAKGCLVDLPDNAHTSALNGIADYLIGLVGACRS